MAAPQRQRQSASSDTTSSREPEGARQALREQQEDGCDVKERISTADRKTAPSDPKSTVLSVEDEAVVVAFRKHTVLPLDDCLHALQPTIPHLTRSSLHRCLQRHGVSRLPDVEGDKPGKKTFKSYPIGYFHIDIAEVQTAEGKLYLFVAIDRTSKFAFARFCPRAGKVVAAEFLSDLIAAVPYAIHTVLTDNGIQFTNRACERMNRTIKEATVKRFHDHDHAQLGQHLTDFIDAYDFGRRLKTLKSFTPYEAICKQWTSKPGRIRLDPIH